MASKAEVADHESVDEAQTQVEEMGLLDENFQDDSFGFDKKTRKSDLILIVQDKRLYVNRTLLEMVSNVFEELFVAKLQDKEEDILEITDTNYADFVEFLACIYPNIMNEVTLDNIYKILPLAFQYDVKSLQYKCESVLHQSVETTSDEEYIVSCMKEATQYGMSKLKQHCFDLIVERRQEDIETADTDLDLDIDEKHAVYTELMPFLRSEACKYKFLSSKTTNDDDRPLVNFRNAKYQRGEFTLESDLSQIVCLKSEIWGIEYAVSVKWQYNYTSQKQDTTFSLSIDKASSLTSSRYVAVKYVIKNHIPGKPDRCIQERRSVRAGESLATIIPLKEIESTYAGFRWNNKYTIVMHLLVNNA